MTFIQFIFIYVTSLWLLCNSSDHPPDIPKHLRRTFDFYDATSTAYKIALDTSAVLKGHLAIVTGSTSGIGKETVRILAMRGCQIIMAARNLTKNQYARQDIIDDLVENNKGGLLVGRKQLNKNIILMTLDLASLDSILNFAQQFYVDFPQKLNYLINNAGVMAIPKYTTTVNGFETQFGVNHLAHYYLTRLLINKLGQHSSVAPGYGRVITVSSRAHVWAPKPIVTEIDKEIRAMNGPLEDNYSPWSNYGISKTYNILFARELQRRFGYTDIISVSLHPGVIRSGLQQYLTKEEIGKKTFDKNIEQGAATTIYCTLIPQHQLVPGGYYDDCLIHMDRLRDDIHVLDGYFDDNFDAKHTKEYKLWELSERLIRDKGFTFEFMVEYTPPPDAYEHMEL